MATKHKIGDYCGVKPEWSGPTPELENIKVKIVAIRKGKPLFYLVKWNESDEALSTMFGTFFQAKELV